MSTFTKTSNHLFTIVVVVLSLLIGTKSIQNEVAHFERLSHESRNDFLTQFNRLHHNRPKPTTFDVGWYGKSADAYLATATQSNPYIRAVLKELAITRRAYNANVDRYNTLINTFPFTLVSKTATAKVRL